MSVQSFNLFHVGSDATSTLSGDERYTLRYRVVVEPGDTALTILEDSQCPQRGAEYTFLGKTFYATSIDVEAPGDDNSILYTVSVTTSDTLPQGTGDTTPNAPQANPIDDADEIEYDSGSSVRTIEYDIDGKLICNSAGDRYEPRVTVPTWAPVVTVVRNRIDPPWTIAPTYANKINSAEWNGAPAGTVLCRGIRGTYRQRNGIKYWRTTFVFEYRDPPTTIPNTVGGAPSNPTNWNEWLWDAGKRDISTGKIKPIEIDGEQVTEDVPLDGNGERLDTVNPDDFLFNYIKKMRSVDFSPLNINLTP